MDKLKLFMLLLGCKPEGRHTEQHDVFFDIAPGLSHLKEGIVAFWSEAKDKIHIDAWREVNYIDGYEIKITARNRDEKESEYPKLFFINLGGYKKSEFDEFHYKLLMGAGSVGEANQQAKNTAFYKHVGFKGAPSHIDDRYGIDVDDAFEVEDILPDATKEKYSILLVPGVSTIQDEIHLGYLKIENI